MAVVRYVYTFVIHGELHRAGSSLKRRNSKGIWASQEIICETGRGDTDVLFVETIM